MIQTEEIQKSSNCIIKSFENHSIFIFNKEINSKKRYYFKANDIGKALKLVSIHSSIQNFDENEVVSRTTLDQKGAMQDTKFLSSAGVYRLLFNSKKPEAKQFREWVSDILDDIIFNESQELKNKLKEQDNKLQQLKNEKIEQETKIEQLKNEKKEQEDQLKISESRNLKLLKKITSAETYKLDGWIYIATTDIYAMQNHFRIGRTKDIQNRIVAYQPGRTVADKLYYVFLYKSENVYYLETIIREFLKQFREDPNIDMYILQWNILHKFINYICNAFHNGIVPQLNELIDKNINSDDIPVIPPRINVTKHTIDKVIKVECNNCKIHCINNVIASDLDNCLQCNHHCFISDTIADLTNLILNDQNATIKQNGIVYNTDNVVKPVIMRKCTKCATNKSILLFEIVNAKGSKKSICKDCIDKSELLCKKCLVINIGIEFRFSENNIRSRYCGTCMDIAALKTKICNICSLEKLTSLFGRYTRGDLHPNCAECYLTLDIKDTRICRTCKVGKNTIKNYKKRICICDSCRSI